MRLAALGAAGTGGGNRLALPTRREAPVDVKPPAVLLPAGHQLSEKVAAHLRDEVMSGRLRGGDFIRPERVASDFGVSATPVREALMALASEGTVTWQPRRGFRVARMTRDDVVDLFDVQAYIAGELAARAVRTMAAADVEGLRGLQVQLENAAAQQSVDEVHRLNHEIHRGINRSAGTSRLTALLGQLVGFVPLRYFGEVEGWAEASAHDHEAIFHALQAGDAAAARHAMAEHIRHVGDLLSNHLAQRGVFDQPDATQAPA